MKNKLFRCFLLIVTYPFYFIFLRSLKQTSKSQLKLRKKIFSEVRKIKRFNNSIECWDEVPVSEYSDYEKWIEKEKNGLLNQSIFGKIINFEKTSGSSGKNKYIPYSKKSMGAFSIMFLIWLHDLLRSDLNLINLKTYISISPNFQPEEKVAQGRVGLESDEDYLPSWIRFFLQDYLISPPHLKKIKDPEEFKVKLLTYLISEKNLEIISIWNPSFMLILLKELSLCWKEIRINVRNRDDLGEEVPELYMIWPRLKLISLWGDANAKEEFYKLKALFPKVHFQKKGLLSTEFPSTVPMIESQFPVPLTHLVYYEFKKDAEVISLDLVKEGETYELILSQPGGFIRYRTHDLVLIKAKFLGTPTLEFVGRNNLVSDMVGEKIYESFAKEALQKHLRENFSFLEAIDTGAEKYYKIIAETQLSDMDIKQIENELYANIHYRYARDLGQLTSLRAETVLDAQGLYYSLMQERGMKIGDIKLSYLVKQNV